MNGRRVSRSYGKGMVGAYGAGRPPFARTAGEYELKPDLGQAELRPTLGGGIAPMVHNRTPVALPAMNFPPEGAYPIDNTSDADIAPAATATIITVPVPKAVQFRIEGIGFASYDPIAVAFLTWSLLVGGQPYRAYTNQNAGLGNIREARDIVFQVSGETTVTLVLTVSPSALSTYRYVARLRGWFFTEEVA